MENSTQHKVALVPALLATMVFIIIGIIILSYHEMWRDEIHIWLLATHADSFSMFLTHRSTESEPIVWHCMVYFFAQISDSMAILSYANLLFLAGSIFLLFQYAPFRKWEKAGLALSYYFLFEYAVIARSYALSILLLFILLTLFDKRQKWLFTTIFILLVNTNVLTLIIGFALWIYLLLRKSYETKFLLVMMSGMFISFADVAWQTFYAYQYTDQLVYATETRGIYWLLHKLSLIQKGYFPLPLYGWNTNWIESIPAALLMLSVATMLSLAIMAIVIRILWRDKKLVFSFAVGTFLLFILFGFFWGGSQRHWGYFFLFFLACYWIYVQTSTERLKFTFFLPVCIVIQIVGGTMMIAKEISTPFSNADEVAVYIKKSAVSNTVITGYPDYVIEPVAAYLHRNFYNLQSEKYAYLVDWNRPHLLSEREIAERLNDKKLKSKSVFLILSTASGLHTQVILDNIKGHKKASSIYMEEAIEKFENYEIILLEPL